MKTTKDMEFVGWNGPLELVRSPKGSLLCTQACTMMVVKALKGRELTMAEAEHMTGYVKGRETWPYEMYLSLADLGLRVVVVDRLNPQAFVDDLEGELRRLFGDNESDISYILSITDVDAETNRVQRCLDHPNISFEVHSPDLKDVYTGLADGALPMVSLDYGVLHQQHNDEFEGHLVVVSAINGDSVEVFDPGPPGVAAWKVPANVFVDAMHSPSEDSGSVTLVWPPA